MFLYILTKSKNCQIKNDKKSIKKKFTPICHYYFTIIYEWLCFLFETHLKGTLFVCLFVCLRIDFYVMFHECDRGVLFYFTH